MTEPAAIVFDFDGVLADTEPLHLGATQRVLTEVGVELTRDEYYGRYLGYDDDGMFARIALDRRLGWSARDRSDLVARKSAMMPLLLQQPGVLFPDAADAVRRLAAHYPLAIASGAQRNEIELVLGAADLVSCFRFIVAAGDTPLGKPAPDPYLRAVALFRNAGLLLAPNGSTARAIAVEDSIWGIESAHAAGLRCVAVATSYAPEQLRTADMVLARVGDIGTEVVAALLDKP